MFVSSEQSYCLDGITATEAGCTKGRGFNPGTQQCDSPQNVPGKLDLESKNVPGKLDLRSKMFQVN